MYIDPNVYTGAPENLAQRAEREQACYRLLESLGIAYTRVDHDAADTIELCHEIEGLLGTEVCKNLFLCNRQQTDFYLLLMPGDKNFRTKDLSKQLGVSRLSFAGPEHMMEFLGLAPGSVSVLGLMNDKEHRVRLVIDKPLLEAESFGCHPCLNTSTLRMKTADVLNTLIPALVADYTVVDLPEPEPAE